MIKLNNIKRIMFYLILIIFWWLVYFLGVDIFKLWKPYAFPNPKGVIEVFIKLAKTGTLHIAVLYSIKRALIGYFISILLGTVLGLFIAKCKFLRDNLKPIILGMQTLPSICWVPFAILWFGLNESAIIFVIVMGSMFCIAISVENGIINTNPLYIKAAKTMGIDERRLYTRVIFPAALPNFIVGLKQGWSFAWRALLSGEVMSASIGLGQVLMLGRDLADINQVMLTMIIIVMVGFIIDKFIFAKIENNILKKMGFKN